MEAYLNAGYLKPDFLLDNDVSASIPNDEIVSNDSDEALNLDLYTDKRLLKGFKSDSERVLLINRYLKQVHGVVLQMRHSDWSEHLAYYVRRLDDPILKDIWEKQFANKATIPRARRYVSSIDVGQTKPRFYTLNYKPRLSDFLIRYRDQAVGLSWF